MNGNELDPESRKPRTNSQGGAGDALAATTAGLFPGDGTDAYAAIAGKSSKSKTAKIAAAAALGGALTNTLVDNGYVSEMTFKCQ